MIKMKMKGLLSPVLAALILLGLGACKTIPPNSQAKTRPIEIGPGPEDMVLDVMLAAPRLLISCNERRKERPEFGEIVAYYLESGELDTLEREGEPAGMVFNPHGIDFATVEGKPNLYVISHDDENQHHFIARYIVHVDKLEWVINYESPDFTSPNALSIRSDGGFYVSNDHLKRGSLIEAMFSQKKCTIVHCLESGPCNIAADKIAYGNGILSTDTEVYQGTTRGNVIYRYRVNGNNLTDRQVVADCYGADNLRRSERGIIVACHIRGMKFLRHAKSADKRSPTVVYEIIPGKEPQLIFADDGSTISAGATGIIYGDKLYVNQVFEPFILEVQLENR